MSTNIIPFGRRGSATDSVELTQGRLRAAVANTLAGHYDQECVAKAQARAVRNHCAGVSFETSVARAVAWAECATDARKQQG